MKATSQLALKRLNVLAALTPEAARRATNAHHFGDLLEQVGDLAGARLQSRIGNSLGFMFIRCSKLLESAGRPKRRTPRRRDRKAAELILRREVRRVTLDHDLECALAAKGE